MVSKKSKEERITEITDAALDVFLEKGYESTTMESIAQKARISKGGLYHHFKSKDMILMVVNQRIGENIEKIIIKSGECASVKEGMLYYIKNYLGYWVEHPKEMSFIFLSMAKVLDNKDLLKYYKEYAVDYIKYFEEAFAFGVSSGEFVSHDVKTSAVTLVAALDGILAYMVIDENLSLDEVVKHFYEKFIQPVEKTKSIS